MEDGRFRATKLPRYGMSNITIDREGPEWMDGISCLDFSCFPLLKHNILEPHLTNTNLPPFYRLLSNTQAKALANWAGKGNLSREALGQFWPADFNADGKIKRNRFSWEIGLNEPAPRPFYHTNVSGGRPMKSMQLVRPQAAQDEKAGSVSSSRKRDTSDSPSEGAAKPGKLVLLRDSQDDEKLFEIQCENDQLRASLKLAQAKHEGLQNQMRQVESAMSVRQDLLTNAIVTYYFSYTNIRLLNPSIATLVDETVSPDDISVAAGGMATLEHRVRVVKELAQRLSIPITISSDLLGSEDEDPGVSKQESNCV